MAWLYSFPSLVRIDAFALARAAGKGLSESIGRKVLRVRVPPPFTDELHHAATCQPLLNLLVLKGRAAGRGLPSCKDGTVLRDAIQTGGPQCLGYLVLTSSTLVTRPAKKTTSMPNRVIRPVSTRKSIHEAVSQRDLCPPDN